MQAIKTKPAPVLRLSSLRPEMTRRLTLIVGGGVLGLGMLFFLLDQPQGATSKGAASSNTVRVVAAAPPPVAHTMKDYSSLMGRNLFKPLVTDTARRNAAGGTKLPNGMMGLPPMSVDGFGTLAKTKAISAAWNYIGSVSIDEVSYALLQQSNGGDYGYYRVGEQVGGGTIRAIQPETLILASAGETVRLPKTSGAPPPTTRTSGPNNAPAMPNAPNGDNSNAAPQVDTQNANPQAPTFGNGNGGNVQGGRRRAFGGGFGGNGGGNFQGGRRRGGNNNFGGNNNGGNFNNGNGGDNNGNNNGG